MEEEFVRVWWLKSSERGPSSLMDGWMGGGSSSGDGTRDGPPECRFSLLSGPRNGLVEGVYAVLP